MFDTATRFNGPNLLDSYCETYGRSVDGIWSAFINTWVTMYTIYPNRLRTDRGSVFTADLWRNFTNQNGIQLRLSGANANR